MRGVPLAALSCSSASEVLEVVLSSLRTNFLREVGEERSADLSELVESLSSLFWRMRSGSVVSGIN